jgi:hypothetical protein
MADQRPTQIEPTIDFQAGVRFDLLRQQFRKNDLFGEIFRADDGRVLTSTMAARERDKGATQQREGIPSGKARGHCVWVIGGSRRGRKFFLDKTKN